ncbi:MAG TPA: SDR family oxidoreductase [Dermatophilaceae bacterium]|jgi:NAD(P)-dependent dehydrogenase (short-subunit alcohol dehydrogenase family)|nr:SDR family oxidoreductase [Dermatophilaceae bacterium]HRB99498.1 SDR family oxidoreductase [Dermatophilaceae bacterium]
MYDVPDQQGRTFVVTGANSGLGKEAAARLAGAGAHVVMAVRTVAKGQAARDEITRRHPDASLDVRALDLADLGSVRAFVAGLERDGVRPNVLVNNAGVMAVPSRMTTVDGFELQWGTNVLGPFALTNLLLPTLLTADTARVVTMSSATASFGRIDFADLDSTRRYTPSQAYAQSKLANLLLGLRLAEVATQRGWSLLSTIAHPGYTNTNLQTAGASLGRSAPKRTLLTSGGFLPTQEVEQGSEPLLFAAADPDAVNGAYYGPDGRFGLVGPTTRVAIPRSARGASLARSLWAVAEDLTGTSLP